MLMQEDKENDLVEKIDKKEILRKDVRYDAVSNEEPTENEKSMAEQLSKEDENLINRCDKVRACNKKN